MTRDEIIKLVKRLMKIYKNPSHVVDRLIQEGVSKVDEKPKQQAREFWIVLDENGNPEETFNYQKDSEYYRTHGKIIHVREVTKDKEPIIFICEVCGRESYQDQSRYHSHMQTMTTACYGKMYPKEPATEPTKKEFLNSCFGVEQPKEPSAEEKVLEILKSHYNRDLQIKPVELALIEYFESKVGE